jgi:hypothetical protein
MSISLSSMIVSLDVWALPQRDFLTADLEPVAIHTANPDFAEITAVEVPDPMGAQPVAVLYESPPCMGHSRALAGAAQ